MFICSSNHDIQSVALTAAQCFFLKSFFAKANTDSAFGEP